VFSGGQPGRPRPTERRRDVFASAQLIDLNDGERQGAFPAFWLLLMILLSILGIVAQAAFA
jgi:hypothetical protein